MSTHGRPNALARESSPYLLQHAHNPVDWMPWGPAAFERARAQDKPIFLSIGYATCHWCHVMERESFENEEIAAILNQHFVPVKVDREERPDIDAIYMAVTQGISGGHGGWPMSLWLTPEGKPITAGTYFPPHDRWGKPGFRSVLLELARVWKDNRGEAMQQAQEITEWLNRQGKPTGSAELGLETLRENAAMHVERFDERCGGFEGAPKFPTPHRLSALLRWYRHSGDGAALRVAARTLDAMAAGGIRDHLGGGFHRYSTDREWLVPHFEKMLYDQALLVEAYLDALGATGDASHGETARDTIEYVLRDLRDDGGAFHSAEDADSEGEEGKFYTWSMAELRHLLGADAEVAAWAWGCSEAGNYRDEATHEATGANILHLPRTLPESAKARDLQPGELKAILQSCRDHLFEHRCRRVRPLLDDKVLTDWNGLMIGALARAGRVLAEPRYTRAAEEAAEFVLRVMQTNGRLLHRYRAGQAGIPAFCEDYAFLANGLLGLYDATLEPRWLAEATRLCRELVRLFFNDSEGLFFTQGSDDPDRLIAPSRSVYDGAIPSGNSAAALALTRTGLLCGDDRLLQVARKVLSAMSPQLAGHSPGFCYALAALELQCLPVQQVTVAGEMDDPATAALLAEVRGTWRPHTLLLLHEPGDEGAPLRDVAPGTASQLPVNGATAAYVCRGQACSAPVTTPVELATLLA
ncbi:MAG: thioredoxin domain-containing protein [Planctomycetes bacterium]|nr:thioredoxin domain-containing protein [Planctomycetota bacterium]